MMPTTRLGYLLTIQTPQTTTKQVKLQALKIWRVLHLLKNRKSKPRFNTSKMQIS